MCPPEFFSQMKLQEASALLQTWFSSSRSEAAWRFVQWSWKLQRSACQLSFLLQCRREGLIPRFISNCVRKPAATSHKTIREHRRHQHCRRLLCDAIEDKCLEKDYRGRRYKQSREQLWMFTQSDYLLIRSLQRAVVTEERISSNARLNRKISGLREADQRVAGTNSSPRGPTPVAAVGVASPSGHTANAEPVHERALVVDDCVSDQTRRLLEHGPSFVPSTGRLTKQERTDVETSVERMAFTLRWQQPQPQGVDLKEEDPPPEIRQDKKLWKLMKRGFKQPPQMDDKDERNMANFRGEVLRAYDRHTPSKPNLTQEERVELKRLRTDQETIIKPSDKSTKLVAMRQELYLQKAEDIIIIEHDHV